MMNSPAPSFPNNESFQTTRWSMVRGASEKPSSDPVAASHVRQALEDLCTIYWYPLYAFARRQGESPDGAMDVTQSFFADLLERSWINQADPKRGRFRSFLITVFRRFLNDQRKREEAMKRGGQSSILSIDAASAEQRYQLEPCDESSPVDAFEREWALALLNRVLKRLEKEYRDKGRSDQFNVLQQYLSSADGDSYSDSADQLGISVSNVKVAVHRLRKRFRILLEDDVAQTVDSPADIQSELNELLAALCRMR